MSDDNKYKMFRNYMCNELGITRQDIERWTKEAVAGEVGKLVGQFDIESKVNRAINRCASEAISGHKFGATGTALREALAKELAKTISIKVT